MSKKASFLEDILEGAEEVRSDQHKNAFSPSFTSNPSEKQPPKKLQKKYRNSTENSTEEVQKFYRNKGSELQKKYRNSTDVKRAKTQNTTDQCTDESGKTYRSSTEEVQINYRSVDLLTGFQEKVFRFLFLEAKENGESVEKLGRKTPKIKGDFLVKATTGTDIRKTREVVRELIYAGLINKLQHKNGPGGWTQYMVTERAYKEALLSPMYRSSTEEVQKIYRNTTGHTTDQSTEITPCSSSNIITNKTTTTDRSWDFSKLDRNFLPKELASKALHELYDLYEGNYEKFQNAIFKVCHSLDLKKKSGEGVRSPAGFVLGVLKKGPSGISESPGFQEWLNRKTIEKALKQMSPEARIRLHNDLGKQL